MSRISASHVLHALRSADTLMLAMTTGSPLDPVLPENGKSPFRGFFRSSLPVLADGSGRIDARC
jgi:hypothetical protein